MKLNKEQRKIMDQKKEQHLVAEVKRLQMENDYLRKMASSALEKECPREWKIANVIYELRHIYKLESLLKFSGMSRSTYYYYLKRMREPDKYSEITGLIQQIFYENKGRYGYRRITQELHNRGCFVNHKTVYKLMRSCGLKCEVRKKRYSSYKGEVGKVVSDKLCRDFKANKPNEKWVTDVTEFFAGNHKVYLAAILDLYNGEIISYDISLHPTFCQIMKMLDKAFEKIPDDTSLIFHSDQGWQYQKKQYQERLKKKGIIQSMSRKGSCLDNAVMENFFGLLKTEMYYKHSFNSAEQLIQEIEEYIEYYNNKRIKCKLNGLSPVQYRLWSA